MENSKNMEIELDDELTAYIIVKSIFHLFILMILMKIWHMKMNYYQFILN